VTAALDIRRSWIVYSVLVLYVAALAIRVPTLNWGGTSPDEYPAAAAKVLLGELSPTQQYYPPFLNYLTAVAFAVYYALGRALHWWNSASAFRGAYFSDVTQFYVLARLVVAALSATVAPLTFLLAIEQGIRLRTGLLIAAIAALLPASLFWSEIAKSDSALGPAFLLLSLTLFRFYEGPNSRGRQVAVAAAVAIAVSFKQSALFFMAPVVLIVFAATLLSSTAKAAVTRAWLTMAFGALLIWLPLNVGILLNLRGFIDAQIVQSQMSIRETALVDGMAAWFATATSEGGGVPVWILLLWFCVPVACLTLLRNLRAQFRLLTMWTSTLFAVATIIVLAGTRQNSQLVLPYSVVMSTTVLLLAGQLVADSPWLVRATAVTLLLAMAGVFAVQSAFVVQQARAEPVAIDVAKAVRRLAAPGTRLLSDVDLSRYLPVSSVGAAEMRDRNERLAEKYAVHLPPVAAERLRYLPDGYVIRSYPFVIGGLEGVVAKDMKVILPFAWPLQPEEWKLDYWLTRDYRMFVFQKSMLQHTFAVYRDFFNSIARDCTLLTTISTKKPLLEDTVLIYRCS
jgi:hypothetical protein